jgi:hypothetical protein
MRALTAIKSPILMQLCRRLVVAETRGLYVVAAPHHRRYSKSHLTPQLPGDRRTNAHKNADVQFAIWNRNGGISAMPATRGTVARSGPEKRASTIAHVPTARRRPGLSRAVVDGF